MEPIPLGSILADASERGLATRNPVRDIRGSRKGRERRAERRQKGRAEQSGLVFANPDGDSRSPTS